MNSNFDLNFPAQTVMQTAPCFNEITFILQKQGAACVHVCAGKFKKIFDLEKKSQED